MRIETKPLPTLDYKTGDLLFISGRLAVYIDCSKRVSKTELGLHDVIKIRYIDTADYRHTYRGFTRPMSLNEYLRRYSNNLKTIYKKLFLDSVIEAQHAGQSNRRSKNREDKGQN